MTSYGLLSLADDPTDPEIGPGGGAQVERLKLIVESAVLAEQAGFARIGLGEHHTSVTLLACLDPVRVAEDLATLDVLSDGRAEVTVARGVAAPTMIAFGIADADSLRPRFDEALRLLLRLLTEDSVTWSGHFRSPLRDVCLQPRPVQQPHPRVAIGGGLSTISCDLAVELGLPLVLPSLFRRPENYLPIVERYRAGMISRGWAKRISVGYPSYVHVARTSQEARARWRPYLERYVRFAVERREGADCPPDYQSMIDGSVAICGSPAEVADRIDSVNDLLGLDVHYMMVDAGGLPPGLEREVIERLGSEVLPRLR